MARVRYLDQEDLAPEDREIYETLTATRGTVLNLFRVLAHTPDLLRRLLGYSAGIRGPLALSPVLRELAILMVGTVTGVEYEVTHHWNAARAQGIPREKLEGLTRGVRAAEASPHYSEAERAVIRYAHEATVYVRVSEQTFDALRSYLDTRQIVELVEVVAYYNMIARILAPLGVEPEPGLQRAP